MKVVFISRHGCFRTAKEAMPLLAKGYDVHLITERVTQGSEHFKTVMQYQDLDQLYNAVKVHRDADIFHAHNEPSWFVTVVKDLGIKAPVVLDVHDSNLLRKTPEQQEAEMETNPEAFRVSVDERNNIQLADGLVYVGPAMKRIIEAEYKPEAPSVILPSYLPRGFYRIDFANWMGGLVYEGRIDMADTLPGRWKTLFQYCDYRELAKKALAMDMPFHIYTPRENKELRAAYHELCILHEPKGINRLIQCLGRHDWGLVGNEGVHEEWKNALPNKLWEYMAGACPVVAMNADESAAVIKEYDVGIVVGSLEELAERWKEHREKRQNVIKRRREFEMENHIHLVENLYKQLTGKTASMTVVPMGGQPVVRAV